MHSSPPGSPGMGNDRKVSEGRSRDRLLCVSPVGRDAMVLLLTWAAGSVDAISYLGLDRVFTANMTGNTVLLGLALGQGRGLAALRSIVALGGFSLGVAIGAMIVLRGQRREGWSPAVTTAVAVEGAILGVFTMTWHLSGAARTAGPVYLLIVLSAIAMGIQSAAIRHLNVPGIATTYITGTLTSFVAGFAGWLRPPGVPSASAKSAANAPAQPATAAEKRHGARLQATVFLIYCLAATASGMIQARLPSLVTFLPLVAVAVVVGSAFMRHR